MHTDVKIYVEYVKNKFPHHFHDIDVLDVGSQDINGNNRQFFDNCTYTGIDIYPGRNVDIVINVNDFDIQKKYDVVISTEMLEHDCDWEQSLLSMYLLLKPRGLLVFTCAGINRKEHGTTRTSPKNSPGTLDYYRNISRQDVLSILPSAVVQENKEQTDLRFYLLK